MAHERLLIATGKALALVAIAIWSLGPIVAMVVSSLRPAREIFDPAASYFFWPSFDSYRALWANWGDFFAGLSNSLIVTLCATTLAVATSALAGYAYSRYRSRTATASVFALIFLRLIP